MPEVADHRLKVVVDLLVLHQRSDRPFALAHTRHERLRVRDRRVVLHVREIDVLDAGAERGNERA